LSKFTAQLHLCGEQQHGENETKNSRVINSKTSPHCRSRHSRTGR